MLNNERLINPGHGLISETLLDHQMPVPMDHVLDDVSRKSKTISIFEKLVVAQSKTYGVRQEDLRDYWDDAEMVVDFIWKKACKTS